MKSKRQEVMAWEAQVAAALAALYMGTSLISNTPVLGPCSRTIPLHQTVVLIKCFIINETFSEIHVAAVAYDSGLSPIDASPVS